MNASTILAAAAAALLNSVSSSQAFDWSSYLQKSPSELRTALGSSATCSDGPFSVPVEFVDATTKVKADLFDPVVNESYKVALVPIGGEDITVDRDEHRSYDVPAITTMSCEIGKEARAWTAAVDDNIFYVSIDYERCRTRREERVFLSEETVAVCRDVDPNEKPFDKEIYKALTASEHHGEANDYSWVPFLSNELSSLEQDAIFRARCDGRSELWDWMRRIDSKHRCLMSIDNSNPSRWEATSMFELYEPSFFRDEIEAHLTSTRLFIDLPAEKQAVEAMLPGLQEMIDGIQAEIVARVAEKKAKDGAVTDLLGAGD